MLHYVMIPKLFFLAFLLPICTNSTEVVLYPYDGLDYKNINVYNFDLPIDEYEDDECPCEGGDTYSNEKIDAIPYIFRVYED